jgi:hypothetical protein
VTRTTEARTWSTTDIADLLRSLDLCGRGRYEARRIVPWCEPSGSGAPARYHRADAIGALIYAALDHHHTSLRPQWHVALARDVGRFVDAEPHRLLVVDPAAPDFWLVDDSEDLPDVLERRTGRVIQILSLDYLIAAVDREETDG